MTRILLHIGFGLLTSTLMITSACQYTEEPDRSEDQLLAEVFSRQLYYSDMASMIYDGVTPEDSILIVNAYVERWVREQLLMQKAEQNIPKDLNLNKLVNDYRESLILNNYERLLIDSQLDSTVSEAQLIEFYEANKDQYHLEKPIAHIFFLQIKNDRPKLDHALSWWNDPKPENLKRLKRYAKRYADKSMLADSTWMPLEDVVHMLPPGVMSENSATPGKEIRFQDQDVNYLLKIRDIRSSLEIAPLAYIRDQATRAILHRRQIDLINRVKDQLYELEIRKNNVKVYTR
ncbi:MAG: peptidyl-prolyl cis-trans isomerase [Saprospiraceae bacterium]|nr:peptidyl-prolyl cis-trans isomerase [Saprospiraceae bacterium]